MKPILNFLIIILSSMVLFSQTPITLDLPNPCSISNIDENTKTNPTFDFSVNPNPTDGMFILEINSKNTIGNVEIQVLNMQGKCLKNESIYSSNLDCIKTININNLPNGIYIIALIRTNEKLSKKIILQKNQ